MAALPADFDFSLALEPSAPDLLQEVARLYWEYDGLDVHTNEILWTRKASEIDFKQWSGTAHYAAAAGGVAVSESFACATCGRPLSLSSRQTLSDARRGVDVECRACNGLVDERALSVLDPKAQAKRQRRAEEEQREASARAIQHEEASARRLLDQNLDAERRAAIEEKYPPATEDDGGYSLEHASIAAHVAALAIIHVAGTDEGLIHPVRYDDASIAPSLELARDLLVAAWHSDLLIIHPTSPSDAFVWTEQDPTTLGDGIYTDASDSRPRGRDPSLAVWQTMPATSAIPSASTRCGRHNGANSISSRGHWSPRRRFATSDTHSRTTAFLTPLSTIWKPYEAMRSAARITSLSDSFTGWHGHRGAMPPPLTNGSGD